MKYASIAAFGLILLALQVVLPAAALTTFKTGSFTGTVDLGMPCSNINISKPVQGETPGDGNYTFYRVSMCGVVIEFTRYDKDVYELNNAVFTLAIRDTLLKTGANENTISVYDSKINSELGAVGSGYIPKIESTGYIAGFYVSPKSICYINLKGNQTMMMSALKTIHITEEAPPTSALNVTLDRYTFTADLPDFPENGRWYSDDYIASVNCADWPNYTGFDPLGFKKKWVGWTGQEMPSAFEAGQTGIYGKVAIYVLRIPPDELHLNDTAILDNASFLTNSGLWEGYLINEGIVSAKEATSGYFGPHEQYLKDVTLRDITFNGHSARLVENADGTFAALSFKLNDTAVATILVGWLNGVPLKADDIFGRITVTAGKKVDHTIRTAQKSVTLDGHTFAADVPDGWTTNTYIGNASEPTPTIIKYIDTNECMRDNWNKWSGKKMPYAFVSGYPDNIGGIVSISVLRIPSDEQHLNDTRILDNASKSPGIKNDMEEEASGRTAGKDFASIKDIVFNDRPARLFKCDLGSTSFAAISFRLNNTAVALIDVERRDKDKACAILNSITVT